MKLLSIVGARPQFVKAAMICRAVREHNRAAKAQDRIRHRLVHTGQHYEHAMSGVFFEQLPLPKPHHYLGVASGPHGAQTGVMLQRIEETLLKERPDITLVYGDTNSTLAGALASAKLHIPVAHLEAGLRSFNRLMPEELNRVTADHLSDILLCPTGTAVRNLRREGITKGVYLTGDVMLDAVVGFRELSSRGGKLLERIGVEPENYVLVTIHRAENTESDKQIAELIDVLTGLAVPAVFPMHPRLRDRLAKTRNLRALRHRLQLAHHVRVIEPVSYLDMLRLEGAARLVLTDSGGVQKEAYFLGIPCITLRQETEWTETLKGRWNQLAGASAARVLPLVRRAWARNGASPTGRPDLAAFGGGTASQQAVRQLIDSWKGLA